MKKVKVLHCQFQKENTRSFGFSELKKKITTQSQSNKESPNHWCLSGKTQKQNSGRTHSEQDEEEQVLKAIETKEEEKIPTNTTFTCQV